MSSVLERLLGLTTKQQPTIRITKDEYIWRVSRNYLHYTYLKNWRFATQYHRIRMLLVVSLTFISVYIISPSITYYFKSQKEKDDMFGTKRKDKHTIGLINTRNDCFANSSVQAFASLPGLNVYLNDIIKQHRLISSLPIAPKPDQKNQDDKLPGLPLHEGLATIVQQLQDTITSSKYISVWPFLQVIEKIFNSKISTNQNDAHELVQLILESLDNESTKLKKYVKRHGLNVVIPSLPFNGLSADQLTCLSCLNSSKPSFHPFSVLSLPVPEKPTTSLSDMIKNAEVETINGYNCLRCKIRAVLNLEEQKSAKGISLNEQDAQIVSKLKIIEPNLRINDDLSEELESFIKNYEYNGFKVSDLQSTIVKKTLVVKAPKLLTVHLSRSLFTANHITRNSCRVEFGDVLDVDVDENLAHAYEDKLREAKRAKKGIAASLHSVQSSVGQHLNGNGVSKTEGEDDDELDDDDDPAIDGYDDDRNEPEQLARIHSKVLAGDEEQIEHVENDENPESSEADNEFETQPTSSSDGTSLDNPDDSDDFNEDEDAEDKGDDESLNSHLSEDLNISRDNAKYRLRAIIRHQGTHNAGHYECFRHKPLLVKDSVSDQIVNLTPTIQITSDNEQSRTSTSTTPEINVDTNQLDHGAKLPRETSRKSSSNRSAGLASPLQNESISRSSDVFESADNESVDETGGFSKFRNRIGSFVSRRSSISQSSGRRNSVANLPDSSPKLKSVGEGVQIDQVTTNFNNFSFNEDGKPKDKRYKKISSVSRYPYWRISDTQVTEVKKSDVLREKAGVYMIYYEQI